MKQIIVCITLAAAFFFCTFPVSAEEKDKFEEIMAMTKESARFLAQKGKDGLGEFNGKEGRWVRGELYVFVYGLEGNERGVIIAHPRAGLVGKNFLKVKDKKGKIFAAEFLRIAKSEKGEGWSEYWWPKLEGSKPEPKVSYIVKVPGQAMLVGVGVYGGHTKEEVLEILGH